MDVTKLTNEELEKLIEVGHHEMRSRLNRGTDQAMSPISRGDEAKERAMPYGLSLDNVDFAFTYQPWDAAKTEKGTCVREALVVAAKTILRVVPASADRSAALRKLREARMDCNSAITFDGAF
jgi:hypothetical protein